MKAIGRYIVVRPDKDNIESTKGGLLLDSKNREDIRYRDAEVISIGDLVPDVIQKGSRIKYDRHAGHGIEIDKEEYKVIKIDDIVIVL